MVAKATKDTTELSHKQRQHACAALSLLAEHLRRQVVRLAGGGDGSGIDPEAALSKADRLDTLIANLRQGASLWLTFESALSGLEALAAGEATEPPLPAAGCLLGSAGLRVMADVLRDADDEGADTHLISLRVHELNAMADLLRRAGSFQVEFDASLAVLEEEVVEEEGGPEADHA